MMPDRRMLTGLVRTVLTRHLPDTNTSTLDELTPLRELGMDSVAMVSIAAELERETGLRVDDDAVFDTNASISTLAGAMSSSDNYLIEVTGAGVVAPTGLGVAAFWSGLCQERAARIAVPYEASRGRHFAGVVPGSGADDLIAPDRLLQLVVIAAEEALGDSPRDQTTIVVGTTDTGGNALSAALDGADTDALTGTLAQRAGRRLGLGGPAYTIGSASASGAVAVGFARELLQAGEADQILVVGADTVSETGFSGLAALRTLSPDGCQPFHARRRGIALSEAAAALLLRRTTRETSGYGVLCGYGASSLTTHPAAPEADGIVLAVRRALADAGVEPADVSFINAHGPGTPLGDIAEIDALTTVFGPGLPPVNSVKGLLWHCQGAAGVIESLACLLSLRHGTLTPTTGATPMDDRWSDVDIVTTSRPCPDGRYALSVSCGLGGVNTALIWGKAA